MNPLTWTLVFACVAAAFAIDYIVNLYLVLVLFFGRGTAHFLARPGASFAALRGSASWRAAQRHLRVVRTHSRR